MEDYRISLAYKNRNNHDIIATYNEHQDEQLSHVQQIPAQ